MRRLMLLAIGLSALLWAISAQPGPVAPAGVAAMVQAESCQLSADADGPGNTDPKWLTHLQAFGVVTGSIWKSTLVNAEPGGTRAARSLETALTSRSPDPPVSSVPYYLRHTPLLI